MMASGHIFITLDLVGQPALHDIETISPLCRRRRRRHPTVQTCGPKNCRSFEIEREREPSAMHGMHSTQICRTLMRFQIDPTQISVCIS